MTIKKAHYRRFGALRYVCGLKVSRIAQRAEDSFPKCKRCEALIILKAKRLDNIRASKNNK